MYACNSVHQNASAAVPSWPLQHVKKKTALNAAYIYINITKIKKKSAGTPPRKAHLAVFHYCKIASVFSLSEAFGTMFCPICLAVWSKSLTFAT